MTEHALPDSEALLSHANWISDLARELVGDPHRAADVVQDTWLAALRRRSVSREVLGGIVRNLSRRQWRGEGRRIARERSVAREEQQASTLDIVERASTQRRVVGEVLALDEPFRSTILLRFFEGLPPREIAGRAGVPIRTVNSRLSRGLERLRERLERAFAGERGSWVMAPVPFVRESAGVGIPSITWRTIVVNKWIVGSVAAAVVAATAAVSISTLDDPGEAVMQALPVGTGVASAPAVGMNAPAEITGTGESQDESGAPARQPAVSEHVAADTPPVEMRGRVIDMDGRPASGIIIQAVSDDGTRTRIVSGPGGVFTIPEPRSQTSFRSADANVVTLLPASYNPDVPREPRLVVARARTLGGRVIDSSAIALSGARVRLLPSEAVREAWEDEIDLDGRWLTETGPEGAFLLDRVPRMTDAELSTDLPGFLTDTRPAPEGSDTAVQIVLERPRDFERPLHGRVVDAEGHGVPNAQVALGFALAVTDATGEFVLDLDGSYRSTELWALKAGLGTARLSAEVDADGDPVWPGYVLLTLGSPPLALSGRVVDAEGQPISGLRVWIADPTTFGMMDHLIVQVEYLQSVEPGASLRDHENAADPFWHWATTDDLGSFRLPGLLEREYKIAVLDDDTLQRVEVGPFAAGRDDVEIVFAPGVWKRLAGRVVSGGFPIEGARLSVRRRSYQQELTLGGRTHSSTVVYDRGRAITDANGRFEFTGVPMKGCLLRVTLDGDDLLDYPLDGCDPDDVEIDVELYCALQVNVAVEGGADELGLLDEDGASLLVRVLLEDGHIQSERAPIREGRSGRLSASNRARTIVLFREGVEVGRLPVRLMPGRENRLEL